MTVDHFLKYEVDDWDSDSNYIYLKLDKNRFDFPVMPINKSELRLWAILTFAPCGDEDLQAELERTSKELKIYKRALELACEELYNDFNNCEVCPVRNDNDKCSLTFCGITSYDLEKYYLQKAREEE